MTATFTSVEVAECPFCGGGAYIPDGVFESLGDAVRILSVPEATQDALRSLRNILRKAQNDNTTPDVVADQIETSVPTLAAIGLVIKKNAAVAVAILTLLLQVINVILSRFPPKMPSVPAPASQVTNVTNITNNIITDVFEQVSSEAQAKIERTRVATGAPKQPKGTPVRRTEKKVGRNDPCTCGSEKKYKKCCGANR